MLASLEHERVVTCDNHLCIACLEPVFSHVGLSGLVFNTRFYIPVYLKLLHRQKILTVYKKEHKLSLVGLILVMLALLYSTVCCSYVVMLKCISGCEYE